MLRAALYALLLGVAAAAAVLSFTTLRDLALMCGFGDRTAWLLPLVIDAGAAAGSLAWLSRAGRGREFGRRLALVLLGLSVVGNALGHVLAAEAARPGWIVVVAVSSVAPAVLGAVVHLAVLCGQVPRRTVADVVDQQVAISRAAPPDDGTSPSASQLQAAPDLGDDRAAELIAAGAGRRRLARELEISEHEARQLLERERASA